MSGIALHIFRRDLRIHDNAALAAARRSGLPVLPVFVFDPRQCQEHPYFSAHGFAFLVSSLAELEQSVAAEGGRLRFLRGQADHVLEQLLATLPIREVHVHRDFTPFSLERDRLLQSVCAAAGVSFLSHLGLLLHAPEEVLKPDGSPYTVFTPFYKRASALPVAAPQALPDGSWYTQDLPAGCVPAELPPVDTSRLVPVPGRAAALAVLQNIGVYHTYEQTRNVPALAQGTTRLSAHLKFGTVSPREVHAAVALSLGPAHGLIRELYWREFFTHIAAHFPHVFRGAFYPQYDALAWRSDQQAFERWQQGLTGFPIVDAGLRELAQTGFMHNRVRMIAASFLIKDLHIDWHWGERHFARLLTDYDPAVNNGSWQWSASTGCDAAPYFRIFNPWLQQIKFDPHATYIKHWVPELAHLPTAVIHDWADPAHATPTTAYPRPMLDHRVAAEEAKQMYKHVLQK